MSITFTKLFSSITESTIWCEPSDTRVVWVTMLAMADRCGRIWGSVPGLANRAQVSLKATEEALQKFLSPDPYSRTPEHEGRRIEVIDGGWRLLNHEKYRAIRDDEERKAYKRDWIRQKREEEKSKSVDNVDSSRPPYTKAEADTEADTDKHKTYSENSIEFTPVERHKVPIKKIVDLYHEILPELPKVVKLTKTRESYLRQRWIHDMDDLKNWRNFFNHVRKSKFLMGQIQPTNGRKVFTADLEWLTKESNFAKIAEGKYHG